MALETKRLFCVRGKKVIMRVYINMQKSRCRTDCRLASASKLRGK